MATELTLRKWGNSMAAIFPKKIVEKEDLKQNEKVLIEIIKRADLRKIFGTLSRKTSGQEFKDIVRQGWK